MVSSQFSAGSILEGNHSEKNCRLPVLAPLQSLEIYHEESINNHIKVKRRKFVAWVAVVPKADLHRHQNSCVDEEKGIGNQHPCTTHTDVRPEAH